MSQPHPFNGPTLGWAPSEPFPGPCQHWGLILLPWGLIRKLLPVSPQNHWGLLRQAGTASVSMGRWATLRTHPFHCSQMPPP